MALPTTADAKSYLRIEHADEDVLVSQLLARAKGMVQKLIGYPLTAVQQTYVDFNEKFTACELQLPGPFALLPTPPVVTDVNGTVIDATTYVLDPREGKIRSKYGDAIFSSHPHSTVATIGLSAHPDYPAELEAIAAIAILDLVAHYYQNRNPAVESESDEGGGSVSLSRAAIPPRIVQDLLLLPCTRGLVVA